MPLRNYYSAARMIAYDALRVGILDAPIYRAAVHSRAHRLLFANITRHHMTSLMGAPDYFFPADDDADTYY